MADSMKKGKVGAVILAGGRGSRMQSQIQKQYMSLGGRPWKYLKTAVQMKLCW